MISSFVAWLVNIIEVLGYPGVALAMFVESFFAPIPSEIILPFSGFVASQGSLNIYIVILVATLAAYLGTLPFYFIGLWGEEYVHKFLEKYGKYLFISEKDMDSGYKAFEKFGYGIVFLGRLIPIVRTVISFPAGASKMKFGLFSAFTLVGTLIWSSLLAYGGYLLGENWLFVSEFIERYERIILMILFTVVAWYFWRGFKRSRKSERADK
jgi:membrane protein DedA with SNARE-associated domain